MGSHQLKTNWPGDRRVSFKDLSSFQSGADRGASTSALPPVRHPPTPPIAPPRAPTAASTGTQQYPVTTNLGRPLVRGLPIRPLIQTAPPSAPSPPTIPPRPVPQAPPTRQPSRAQYVPNPNAQSASQAFIPTTAPSPQQYVTVAPGQYYNYQGHTYQYVPGSVAVPTAAPTNPYVAPPVINAQPPPTSGYVNHGITAPVQPTGAISTVPITRFNPVINQARAHFEPATYKENLTTEKIRVMIDTHVGRSPTQPIKEYAKAMKSLAPPTYSGQDDDQLFTTWLNGYLTYCRRLNITGPENEDGRLDLLTQILKDEAATWLYNTVLSPGRQRADWTFEEVIIALYQRFVVTDAFRQAEVKFSEVKYDPKKGALGLSEELNQWASQMLEHPSAKVLRDKFIACLPPKLEEDLVLHHALDPDFTPYETWCAAAIRVQRAEEGIKMRRKISGQPPSARQLQITAASNVVQSRTVTARSPSGRTSTFRPISKDNATTPQAVYAKKTSFVKKDFGKTASSSRPRQQSSSRPSQRTGQFTDKSKIDCYNCWEKGHMKKDCKNPTRPQPPGIKIYLMDVTDTEEQDDDENPPEPPDSDDESFIRFETNSEHDYERPSLEERPIEAELQTIHVSIDEDEKTPEWLDFEQEHADDFERMQILQSFQMQADPPKTGRNYWLYDPRVTRLTAAQDQPVRDVKMMQPITIEVKLNGVPCYVLVDTGCNTNSFGPITARIVNADRIDLKEQVQLQLGTKGSRTKINYGTRVNVNVGPINESVYFDIVDIDRYDAILGMPFLTKHNAVVNLGKRTLSIGGVNIPVYTAVEEAEIRKDREQRRREAVSKYLLEIDEKTIHE
ncbi:hypothetical protein LXA43DRAFT_906385 [Ganoderma leucocontextum]|nr:hypothetical protein LXA43DRAFT_906385 [Ganoderma leucocontextum]